MIEGVERFGLDAADNQERHAEISVNALLGGRGFNDSVQSMLSVDEVILVVENQRLAVDFPLTRHHVDGIFLHIGIAERTISLVGLVQQSLGQFGIDLDEADAIVDSAVRENDE